MGMAASQARYLALTARKTNTEWEGQQINQARTALANQSANLFNQLLGMQVPNAPKTSDYTKLQYSYSDGNNDSVFEEWHQINTPNPNYNYVVSHYYNADVYTGIARQLIDPQVQLNNVLVQMEYNKLTTLFDKDENENLVVTYKINDYDHEQKYFRITDEQIALDEDLKNALTNFEKYYGIAKADGSLVTESVFGYKDEDNTWHFFVANDYNKVREADASNVEKKDFKRALELYEVENDLTTSDGELKFEGIYKTRDEEGNWSFVNIDEYTQMTPLIVEAPGAEELKDALYKFEEENDLLYKHKELNYENVYGKQTEDGSTWAFTNTVGYKPVKFKDVETDESLKEALSTYEDNEGIRMEDGSLRYHEVFAKKDDEGNWVFTNTIGYKELTKEEIDGDEELKNALDAYEDEADIKVEVVDITYDRIYGVQDDEGNWSFLQFDNRYTKLRPSDIDTSEQDALSSAIMDYEIEHNLLNPDGSINFSNIYGKQNEDRSWTITDTNNYHELTPEEVEAPGAEKLRAELIQYEIDNEIINPDGSINYNNIYGYYNEETDEWSFTCTTDFNQLTAADIDTVAQDELRKAATKFEISKDLMVQSPGVKFEGIYTQKNDKGGYDFINIVDYQELSQEIIDAPGAEDLKEALIAYETENDLFDDYGNLTFDGIYGYKETITEIDETTGEEVEKEVWKFINTNDANIYKKVIAEDIDYSKNDSLREALTKYETEHKLLNEDGSLNFDGVYAYQDEDKNWHFDLDKFCKEESYTKAKDYIDYSSKYGPKYVGNSELTELNQLIVDRNTGLDQVADLAQILRDCPDNAIKNYVSFDDYGNLQYEGKGIYTFNLYGQTYYTTLDDLMESYGTAKNSNTIDDQNKLTYYSAAYVAQKVRETNQALIEKDSDGRFKNVKFDNDSAVYDLNVEEVMNEQAYNDAMNTYLNKKAQYEKTVADINAKTSIIQKEDRTLELRLKQLDTEQNALATEMDAVKKVIKDNVEKTFKTFSD